MSDFLIKFDQDASPQQMLGALTRIAGATNRQGTVRQFSWGAIALLPERCGVNTINDEQGLCGWVGDLVVNNPSDLLVRLRETLRQFTHGGKVGAASLVNEPPFPELNGAFAIVLADQRGCWVVTDPMNFVQVYETRNAAGQLLGIGTHADTVTAACGESGKLDLCSVAEFLNAGTPSFPHTLHQSTKELPPGAAHWFDPQQPTSKPECLQYWAPPPEEVAETSLAEQAEFLRNALTQAIRDRSTLDPMGVFLSGGLDSRVVLNLVPRETRCRALTFSNSPNRETRIAQRVAESLGREWQLLLRPAESLAKSLPEAVRILGCEYEWVHAQVIALRSQLAPLGLRALLLGTQFNVYFKGYWAGDWQRHKRGAGFLPPAYSRRPVNHLDVINPDWQGLFRPEIAEQILHRRRTLFQSRQHDGRGSLAEWLEVYPFTQERGNGFWLAERRLMPVRYVAMDRRLLDFAFRCPMRYKLGGQVFDAAVAPLYGPSAAIPAAADGVRPLSGHASRLVQRAGRKAERTYHALLTKSGVRKHVQHSWHDYDRYWHESPGLAALLRPCSAHLQHAQLPILSSEMGALLYSPRLTWRQGFRLLQLALWLRNNDIPSSIGKSSELRARK